jgi:hypothetical protein
LLALFFGHGLFFLHLFQLSFPCRTPLRNLNGGIGFGENRFGGLSRYSVSRRSFPVYVFGAIATNGESISDKGRFDTLSRDLTAETRSLLMIRHGRRWNLTLLLLAAALLLLLLLWFAAAAVVAGVLVAVRFVLVEVAVDEEPV